MKFIKNTTLFILFFVLVGAITLLTTFGLLVLLEDYGVITVKKYSFEKLIGGCKKQGGDVQLRDDGVVKCILP